MAIVERGKGIRVKVDSIRDYQWTAAVTARLLFGQDEIRNEDV